MTAPNAPSTPPTSQPSITLTQSIIKIAISAGAAGVTYLTGKGYLNAAVAASIAAAIPNIAEAVVDNIVAYLNKKGV